MLERSGAHPGFWGTLYAVSFAVAGYEALAEGTRAALRLRLDVDFLMAVAAIGAAAIGEYAEGAMLLVLFSLGHGLEHYAMGQARKAIRALGRLTPTVAWVRRGGAFVEVPVASVTVGDVVRIQFFSNLPSDAANARGVQGRTLIGFRDVRLTKATTAINSTFSAAGIPANAWISATATRLVGGVPTDSSQFSLGVRARAG